MLTKATMQVFRFALNIYMWQDFFVTLISSSMPIFKSIGAGIFKQLNVLDINFFF
jgi:hypothetical protein